MCWGGYGSSWFIDNYNLQPFWQNGSLELLVKVGNFSKQLSTVAFFLLLLLSKIF